MSEVVSNFDAEKFSNPVLAISNHFGIDGNLTYLYAQVLLKRLRTPFYYNSQYSDRILFTPHEYSAIKYFEGSDYLESKVLARVQLAKVALNQHAWTDKETVKTYDFDVGIESSRKNVSVQAGSIEQALEDAKEAMNVWSTSMFMPIPEDWKLKFAMCTVWDYD